MFPYGFGGCNPQLASAGFACQPSYGGVIPTGVAAPAGFGAYGGSQTVISTAPAAPTTFWQPTVATAAFAATKKPVFLVQSNADLPASLRRRPRIQPPPLPEEPPPPPPCPPDAPLPPVDSDASQGVDGAGLGTSSASNNVATDSSMATLSMTELMHSSNNIAPGAPTPALSMTELMHSSNNAAPAAAVAALPMTQPIHSSNSVAPDALPAATLSMSEVMHSSNNVAPDAPVAALSATELMNSSQGAVDGTSANAAAVEEGGKKDKARSRSHSRKRSSSRKRSRSGKGRSRSRSKGRSRSRGRSRSHRRARSSGRRRSRSRSRSRRRGRSPEKRKEEPPAAPAPAMSLADAVEAAAAEQRRKQQAKNEQAGARTGLAMSRMPVCDSKMFKIVKMQAGQIRAFIGRGGETLRHVKFQTGCDIKVHHQPADPEGSISIVGNTELCMKMIREHLTAKGCPLPPEGTNDNDAEEVTIPAKLTSLFIGSGGTTNKKLKDLQHMVGDGAFVSVQPPKTANGLQWIKIIGANRAYAKAMLQSQVDKIAASPYSPDYGEQRLDKLLTR